MDHLLFTHSTLLDDWSNSGSLHVRELQRLSLFPGERKSEWHHPCGQVSTAHPWWLRNLNQLLWRGQLEKFSEQASGTGPRKLLWGKHTEENQQFVLLLAFLSRLLEVFATVLSETIFCLVSLGTGRISWAIFLCPQAKCIKDMLQAKS